MVVNVSADVLVADSAMAPGGKVIYLFIFFNLIFIYIRCQM